MERNAYFPHLIIYHNFCEFISILFEIIKTRFILFVHENLLFMGVHTELYLHYDRNAFHDDIWYCWYFIKQLEKFNTCVLRFFGIYQDVERVERPNETITPEKIEKTHSFSKCDNVWITLFRNSIQIFFCVISSFLH